MREGRGARGEAKRVRQRRGKSAQQHAREPALLCFFRFLRATRQLLLVLACSGAGPGTAALACFLCRGLPLARAHWPTS